MTALVRNSKVNQVGMGTAVGARIDTKELGTNWSTIPGHLRQLPRILLSSKPFHCFKVDPFI